MKSISIRSITKVVFSALVLAGSVASAQSNSATANADATASVVSAISLTKVDSMNFGEVVAGGTAGTVVLTAAGARSATGGTTLGNPTGVSTANFTVGGDANATFAITLPGSSITLTKVAGTETMTAGTFTSSPAATGTIGAGGTATLAVGATLNVGTNAVTPAGTYNSAANAIVVTVAYN